VSSVLLAPHRQYPRRATAPPPGSVAGAAEYLPAVSIHFSKARPAPASPPSHRTSAALAATTTAVLAAAGEATAAASAVYGYGGLG
jgi:hypothetical protein